MGVHGEGHPGQARLQGQVGRARVSGGQGLHQDRCTHWVERLPSRRSQQQLRTAGTTTWLMRSQRISSLMASRDYCCCGCHAKIRFLGRSLGKCLLQLVESTGREVLVVLGTSTVRKCSKPLGSWSQLWNKAFLSAWTWWT